MDQSAWYRKYGYGQHSTQDAQTPNRGVQNVGVQNLGGFEAEGQESRVLFTDLVPLDVSSQLSSPPPKANHADWSTKYGQRPVQNAAEAVVGQNLPQNAKIQSPGLPNARGAGQDEQIMHGVDTTSLDVNSQKLRSNIHPAPAGGNGPARKRTRVREPMLHHTNEQHVSLVNSLSAPHSNSMGPDPVQNARRAGQDGQHIPPAETHLLSASFPPTASGQDPGLVGETVQDRHHPGQNAGRVGEGGQDTHFEDTETLDAESQNTNPINYASASLSNGHHRAQPSAVTSMTGTETAEGLGQDGERMRRVEMRPSDAGSQYPRSPTSFSVSIPNGHHGAQSFDKSITGTENTDQYNRDLPGDEMDDDLLNGYI